MSVVLKFGSRFTQLALPLRATWKLLLPALRAASLLKEGARVSGFRATTILVLTLGLSGCLNPNLYTSPRATPVGQSTIGLAPQIVQQTKRVQNYAPTMSLRYGVVPRFDVGMRLNFGSLAADLKWNVVRTTHFDLAIDGGGEILPQAYYAHLPLLLGFNLASDVSLLANTGVTLGTGDQPKPFGQYSTDDPAVGGGPVPAGSPFWRAGLGAQLRFTPTFAVQPEVSALYYVGRSPYVRDYYAGGIGLIWGRSPY